jgi:hypothetical protein
MTNATKRHHLKNIGFVLNLDVVCVCVHTNLNDELLLIKYNHYHVAHPDMLETKLLREKMKTRILTVIFIDGIHSVWLFVASNKSS